MGGCSDSRANRDITSRTIHLFPELPRPSPLFLIVFDFRRLDGGEQALEFGLGRVADGANGHDRFAGGKHDLGRSVELEAQHHGGKGGIMRKAFNPGLGIARRFAVRGHKKRETVFPLRQHVLLFNRGNVPEQQSVCRFSEPRDWIDFNEGVAGDKAIKRGHLPVDGADGVLRRLEPEVLSQVALAVRLAPSTARSSKRSWTPCWPPKPSPPTSRQICPIKPCPTSKLACRSRNSPAAAAIRCASAP